MRFPLFAELTLALVLTAAFEHVLQRELNRHALCCHWCKMLVLRGSQIVTFHFGFCCQCKGACYSALKEILLDGGILVNVLFLMVTVLTEGSD